ncbi:hypothetical protein [Burkholderia arboris]|uniref:Uncharacterized protein n=1 Tax=Burkholderia arboris TaxID=488730 RepID=A0A9Q9SQU4_9BURK|nr:hypothetical protein [Burkholderia arboris]MCA8489253.1 hypothetical protein [Burkholderia arboris]UTV59789.1 hypothetical protein NLX30_36975 [Burkholderia arboris]VWC39761.1 hypothetical protein BAR24066_06881 [Burkholderia arboris]
MILKPFSPSKGQSAVWKIVTVALIGAFGSSAWAAQKAAAPPFAGGQQAGDAAPQVEVRSDYSDYNGSTARYRGNVVAKVSGVTRYSAKSINVRPNGEVLMEDLQVQLGQEKLRTRRAVMPANATDGTVILKMEEAEVTR